MPRTQIDGQQIKDDSVTGTDIKEETLVLEKIPFSDAEFSALNAKAAIKEARQGTFDPDTILTDAHNVLVDSNGNVLIEV